MISVEDLRKWADEHAIGRSPSNPRGWVSAKDLLVLARMVEAKDPLNFYYSVRSNLLTQEAEYEVDCWAKWLKQEATDDP